MKLKLAVRRDLISSSPWKILRNNAIVRNVLFRISLTYIIITIISFFLVVEFFGSFLMCVSTKTCTHVCPMEKRGTKRGRKQRIRCARREWDEKNHIRIKDAYVKPIKMGRRHRSRRLPRHTTVNRSHVKEIRRALKTFFFLRLFFSFRGR